MCVCVCVCVFFCGLIAEFYIMDHMVGIDNQEPFFHVMINVKLESEAALWAF